jgi:hypothetical protein
MLASRLRDLIERGVLTTAPASDGSAYQEYQLTERGRRLFLVIVALRQWGEGSLYRPGEPHSVLVDTAKGKPVAALELRAGDGRVLGCNDVRDQRSNARVPSLKRRPHRRRPAKLARVR